MKIYKDFMVFVSFMHMLQSHLYIVIIIIIIIIIII